ncbi:MAG TPA: ABC transporter substrate-binding protein [Pseudonocardia sp.]|nr:ABC transporter substrate-binding protein [Pseudonocardia sp.]
MVASDAAQGPAIADFLIAARKPSKVFVVSDDQEYSVGIADAANKELEAKGVSVQRDQFTQGASDYSSTIAKIKAFDPVFLGGYYAQGGRLLKQVRDAGLTATFATGDGSLDVGLVNGAGAKAAEGAIIRCPCAVVGAKSTQGELKTFHDAYQAKYHVEPAVYAAEGHDATSAHRRGCPPGRPRAAVASLAQPGCGAP